MKSSDGILRASSKRYEHLRDGRASTGRTPREELIVLAIGLFGILLSASWFVVIRPYRQLNSAKTRVLHDLETKLAYPFFTLEWDPESAGRKSNQYWRLTLVEQTLPIIFLLQFFGLIIYAFYALCR